MFRNKESYTTIAVEKAGMGGWFDNSFTHHASVPIALSWFESCTLASVCHRVGELGRMEHNEIHGLEIWVSML